MASRGLGTLTLDLVAKIGGFTEPLGKAERELDKRARAIEQRSGALNDAVVGAFRGMVASIGAVGIGAALTDFSRGMAQSVKDVERFAALANTNATTFQLLAAGAGKVGIEQEKLADIFKDTQDKVGDFLATGGGELKDFFDTIAKQAGVTAEQFRALSGPDALQLYFSTLQRAGLSQSEMVFYLEAIADEASALAPLLRDNGAGFRKAGEEAERYGAIMGGGTIAASRELAEESRALDLAFTGLRNQLATALLPAVSDVVRSLRETITEGDGARQSIESLRIVFDGVVSVGSSVVGTLESIRSVLSGIRGDANDSSESLRQLVQSARGLASIPSGLAAYAEGVTGKILGDAEMVRSAAEKYSRANRELQHAWDGTDPAKGGQGGKVPTYLQMPSYLTGQQPFSLVSPVVPFVGAPGRGSGGTRRTGAAPPSKKAGGAGKSEAEREAEALQRAYASMNEQLGRQVALFGEAGEAARVRYELENGELARLLPAQKEELLAKATQLDYLEGEAKVREELKRIQEDREAVDAMIAGMEAELVLVSGTNAERIREIALRMGGKNATAEQVAELERWIEVNERAQRSAEMWNGLQRNMSDTIFDLSKDFGNARNAIGSFFDSMADDIRRFIADEWAEQLKDVLKSFAKNNAGGTGWAGIASSLLGAMGYGGGKASGGYVGPGRLYEVNERGPELLSVGGRDMLMMGASGGHITPNHRLGGGAVALNQTFIVQGTPDRRTREQMSRETGRAAARGMSRTGR